MSTVSRVSPWHEADSRRRALASSPDAPPEGVLNAQPGFIVLTTDEHNGLIAYLLNKRHLTVDSDWNRLELVAKDASIMACLSKKRKAPDITYYCAYGDCPHVGVIVPGSKLKPSGSCQRSLIQ